MAQAPKNTLNPDISIILDGAAGSFQRAPVSSSGDDPAFDGGPNQPTGGFTLQEAELAVTSIVDPYFKGEFYLAIPNSESPEVEEAFLTTTSLPAGLQIKAGKFRSSLGRQNGQHLHAQFFARRPLINQYFLGVDGLSSPGAQVSWLLPIPFYSVLYLEGFSVESSEDPESPVQSFGGGNKGNLTMAASLKNSFPLDEDREIVLGFNYARGKSSTAIDPATNDFLPGNNIPTSLLGVDLFYKFKPGNVKETYYSLAFQVEYFRRFFESQLNQEALSDGGIYTQLIFQVARRWFLGVRLDLLGLPTSDFVKNVLRWGGSITFAPSEFSKIRLYAENEVVSSGDFPQVSPASSFGTVLQYEIAFGAHSPHTY